jgi:hypothetical protein
MQTSQHITNTKRKNIETITKFFKPCTHYLLPYTTSVINTQGDFNTEIENLSQKGLIQAVFDYTGKAWENSQGDIKRLPGQMLRHKENAAEVMYYTEFSLFKNAWKNSIGDLEKFRSEVKGTDNRIQNTTINKIFFLMQETQPIPVLEHIDLSELSSFNSTIKKVYPNSTDDAIKNLFESLHDLKDKNFKDLDIDKLKDVKNCIKKIEEQNPDIFRERNRIQQDNKPCMTF